MAAPLRSTVRRLATSVRRAAAAEATNTYGSHGQSINVYGIGVSKAQGVVDGLTGGMSLPKFVLVSASVCATSCSALVGLGLTCQKQLATRP
jgi:hypothetical protein